MGSAEQPFKSKGGGVVAVGPDDEEGGGAAPGPDPGLGGGCDRFQLSIPRQCSCSSSDLNPFSAKIISELSNFTTMTNDNRPGGSDEGGGGGGGGNG
jgi:hypothetical protein